MTSGRLEEEVMVAGIQVVECRWTKVAIFRASGSHTHELAIGVEARRELRMALEPGWIVVPFSDVGRPGRS